MSKLNLLDLTRKDLTDFFLQLGEKSFRADQIVKWIHQLGLTNFELMTNFSLALRRYLDENAEVSLPTIAAQQTSIDGTQKFLLRLEDNNHIETVFIPELDRGTLCISTQVGCPLQCAFCATGKLGLQRNLKTSEIVGQLWLTSQKLAENSMPRSRIITNVVLMGMGEPLLNFDNVVKALDLMCDDFAYGLSKYRVTVSTAGLVPEIKRLSEVSEVALAISLHAPSNELRDFLVPINKKYSLEELLDACRNYYKDRRRQVTFEYIMLDDINDSRDHARQLVRILHGISSKINLIPANQVAGFDFRPSNQEKIDKFRQVLLDAGFNTITRKTRGADIDAACGQLAAKC